MAAWQIALVVVGALFVAAAVGGLLVYLHERRYRDQMMKRIRRLPWRLKVQLARDLASHPQAPPLARLLAPLMVAYLLLPLDLIPDFIPVIGGVDDILVIGFSLWLLVRLIPRQVLVACVEDQERRASLPIRV
jgi:uncharacterized membrane protein YkvA (DUF1232 family)